MHLVRYLDHWNGRLHPAAPGYNQEVADWEFVYVHTDIRTYGHTYIRIRDVIQAAF